MHFLLTLLFGATAFAYDSRLEVDPTQDLQALERTGDIKISLTRDDRRIAIDASAVLKVDLQRLYAVVVDFDHYIDYGVPDLREIRVVDHGPGDLLYQWQNLVAAGQESKQYLEVRLKPALTDMSAKATEWQMVPKRASWQYPDRSQFTSLEGSWYMQPLPDGTVYSRYFQVATIGLGLPGWLIELVVRNTLVGDTKKVIRALAKAAPQR